MDNDWGRFANQIGQAYGANAPRPAQPGQGMGNRAYAPGVMSGNYRATPEAHAMYRGAQREMDRQNAGNYPIRPGGPPASPQPMQQGQPQGQPSQWTPMMQAQILDYLMNLMMQRAQAGQKGYVSSGGITNY